MERSVVPGLVPYAEHAVRSACGIHDATAAAGMPLEQFRNLAPTAAEFSYLREEVCLFVFFKQNIWCMQKRQCPKRQKLSPPRTATSNTKATRRSLDCTLLIVFVWELLQA